MRERERYALARSAAEAMYMLWELEYPEGAMDLDKMMRRLKDMSAYSLIHAEIMWQRKIVELLALGMFFGMSSNSGLRRNQDRLRLLSAETFAYKGNAEAVEQQVAQRKAGGKPAQDSEDSPLQPAYCDRRRFLRPTTLSRAILYAKYKQTDGSKKEAADPFATSLPLS